MGIKGGVEGHEGGKDLMGEVIGPTNPPSGCWFSFLIYAYSRVPRLWTRRGHKRHRYSTSLVENNSEREEQKRRLLFPTVLEVKGDFPRLYYLSPILLWGVVATAKIKIK